MAERIHDIHFPEQVVKLLGDAGLRSELGPLSTMVARCGACLLRRGLTISANNIAGCLNSDRTGAAHQLKHLEIAGLLEPGPKQFEEPGRGRPHFTFKPTEAAQPAFDIMPPLSGCEEFYRQNPGNEVCSADVCPLQDFI